MAKSILISGGGIAGACLAWWLERYGFAVTLVERAPAFRRGGYMIDFWGTGYDVAERMGLIATLQRASYLIESFRLVDRHGHAFADVRADAFLGGTGTRYFSLPRGDLAGALCDALPKSVDFIFSAQIAALEQDAAGVTVHFERGGVRRFDLVIGADGLHSTVRQLIFPARSFEHWLGYVAAVFTDQGYPHRDEGTYLTYAKAGRQISRYAMREDRTGFLIVLAARNPPVIAAHDVEAQKRYLHQSLRGLRWEVPEILSRLDRAPELYFDLVSQVRLPRWCEGRVGLVGDAASSPSLMAGEGSALGMLGAYVLAGELARAGGDHTAAFKAYENRLQGFMAKRQRTAERFASSFAPRTAIGTFVRNQFMKAMQIPWLGQRVLGASFGEGFVLPGYP